MRLIIWISATPSSINSLSSGQNVAVLSGVLNANIFQTIHRSKEENFHFPTIPVSMSSQVWLT
jgi:hypothetical protein